MGTRSCQCRKGCQAGGIHRGDKRGRNCLKLSVRTKISFMYKVHPVSNIFFCPPPFFDVRILAKFSLKFPDGDFFENTIFYSIHFWTNFSSFTFPWKINKILTLLKNVKQSLKLT